MPHSRRAVLIGLAAIPPTLAGCLADPDGDQPAGEQPDGRDDDSTENEHDDSVDEPDDHSPGEPTSYGLTVESIDPEALAVAYDVGVLAAQPPAVREAVRAAAGDGYETDAVDDELRQFVADHEYVRTTEDGDGPNDDGNPTYVRLEATFPEEVLVLEPVEATAVESGDAVGSRTFREDPVSTEAISRAIRNGEARRYAYPPFLHGLVADYDYVTPTEPGDEDADFYAWSLEFDDRGGPPYELDAWPVDRSTVYRDAIVAFETLSPDARAEFQDALETDRVDFEESPAILEGGPPLYVRYEGQVYEVAVDVGRG